MRNVSLDESYFADLFVSFAAEIFYGKLFWSRGIVFENVNWAPWSYRLRSETRPRWALMNIWKLTGKPPEVLPRRNHFSFSSTSAEGIHWTRLSCEDCRLTLPVPEFSVPCLKWTNGSQSINDVSSDLPCIKSVRTCTSIVADCNICRCVVNYCFHSFWVRLTFVFHEDTKVAPLAE